MAVNDFLETYKNSMLNKKTINPLSVRPVSDSLNPRISATTPVGTQIPDWLKARTDNASNTYNVQKSAKTTDLAADYSKKAAGQIPVDEFGIVQNKKNDFGSFFNNQVQSISNKGDLATATVEARAQWQQLQSAKEASAGYSVNYTPGASDDSIGSKAVSAAINAMNSGVNYVFGGTSLKTGVDCSGLVQSIYKSLGVTLPRTSYEQAKSGKQVSLNNLLPGDLVFYNTGSSDPNGIGSLSHVAIYIGNGQVISALNSKSGIKIQPVNNNGGAVRAVRPW